MDARRAPRAVIDPKVRKVGFFAPPEASQSGPPDPISFQLPPSSNSLSPVMIPPPCHAAENLGLHARPDATSPSAEESVAAGSYSSSSEFFHAPMSPAPSSRIVLGNGDFFHGAASSPGRGGGGKVASSFPRGGFDLTVVNDASLAIRGAPLWSISFHVKDNIMSLPNKGRFGLHAVVLLIELIKFTASLK